MRATLEIVIVGGSAATDAAMRANAATISPVDVAAATASSGGARTRSITFSVASFWML